MHRLRLSECSLRTFRQSDTQTRKEVNTLSETLTRRAKLQAVFDALDIPVAIPVGGIDGAVAFLYEEFVPQTAEELTLEERVARLEAAIA